MKIFLILFLFSGLLFSSFQKKDTPYVPNSMDPKIEFKVDSLLSLMTLEEKIQQLYGDPANGFWQSSNKRLEIPALKFADAGLGIRMEGPGTALPCGTAMAATWDTSLMHRVGVLLANETRAKGYNVCLAPLVNISRLPIAGRFFESLGEDPFLVSQISVYQIKGIQSKDVAACIKTIACNNQEWKRMIIDARVSERALREIYLPSFESAVKEAGVMSIMSGYNKVNGLYCAENKHLLTDIVKNEWGFTGFVVSDWGGTNSTTPTALAGLDIEMPGAKYFGDSLLVAVKGGKVPMAIIDDKVRRLLRAKYRIGLFANPPVKDIAVLHSKESKRLALEAAQKAIVLLKNQDNILPLNLKKIKSIAVIGPNAATAYIGGGGSSGVDPFYSIAPLDGIKSKSKSITINYALGSEHKEKLIYDADAKRSKFEEIIPACILKSSLNGKIVKGLKAEYFNNNKLEGKPIIEKIDPVIDFIWQGSPYPEKLIKGNFSVRWSGILVPEKTGNYRVKIGSSDGMRVFLKDKLLFSNWYDLGCYEPRSSEIIYLEAGKEYNIKVEYYNKKGGTAAHLTWVYQDTPNPFLASAIDAAKKSDVAILFIGFNKNYEHEGLERVGGMELPSEQNELVKAVVKANKNTIIVLTGGGPVNLGLWENDVPGILETFYLGQETGNAIADVLFGDINPSGKLPFSFIQNKSQSPVFENAMPENDIQYYKEGVYVGYRWLDKNNISPLYPFGFGLSYTTFNYSDIKIQDLGKYNYRVSFKITNTGGIDGSEIAQLYIKDKECTVDRPEKELKGFIKTHLAKGETKTVSIELNRRSFAFFSEKNNKWTVEPGEFEVQIGSSSRDMKLFGTIHLKPE